MRTALLTTGTLLLAAVGWLAGPPWPLRLSLELLDRPPRLTASGSRMTHHTLALPAGRTLVSLPLPVGGHLRSVRTTLTAGAGTSAGLSGLVLSSGDFEGRWGITRALAAGATTDATTWQGGPHLVHPGDVLTVQALAGAFDGTGVLLVTLELEEP